MQKRTEWIGNLLKNNYITCVSFEYSDRSMATDKWHLGEEVACLLVINNIQEERGGGNGLHYSYVVGSAHPEGTFLKNSQWHFPLLLPFRFAFCNKLSRHKSYWPSLNEEFIFQSSVFANSYVKDSTFVHGNNKLLRMGRYRYRQWVYVALGTVDSKIRNQRYRGLLGKYRY